MLPGHWRRCGKPVEAATDWFNFAGVSQGNGVRGLTPGLIAFVAGAENSAVPYEQVACFRESCVDHRHWIDSTESIVYIRVIYPRWRRSVSSWTKHENTGVAKWERKSGY